MAQACGAVVGGIATCTAANSPYASGISYTNRSSDTTINVQPGTTITPNSGNPGINLTSAGGIIPPTANLTVNSNANITTTGNNADGINVSGPLGNRTVNSVGNISTSGNNSEGINATGSGTISVFHNGTIGTNGTGAEGVNAVGTSTILDVLTNRSVSVTVTGDIITQGSDSTGVNAVRQVSIPFVGDRPGLGDITVNVKNVTASGTGSLGINATNAAGNIDITAGNVISNGTGVNAQVRGLSVSSYNIPGTGNINLKLGSVTSATGNGVNATTGIGNVDVSSGIVQATTGFGVNATTNAGNVTVDVGDVTSLNRGINATTLGGMVDVSAGNVKSANGQGVNAVTGVGTATVDVLDVESSGLGINAQVTGLGPLSIGIASVSAGNVTSATAGGVNATTGTGAALAFVNNVNSVTTGVNVKADTGLALGVANDVNTTAANAHGINAEAGGVAIGISTGKVTTKGDGAIGVNAVATSIADTGPLAGLIDSLVDLPGGAGELLDVVDGGVAIAIANDVSTEGAGATGVNARADEGVAGAFAFGTVNTTGANANGVQAYGAQFAGAFAGDVNATGTDSKGVIAQATNGSALALAGDVTSHSTGVTASATSGFVGVGVGDVTTTGTNNAGGIDARITSGDAYVLAGDVKTVGDNSTGIHGETQSGSTYIVAGDVTTSGDNSSAIVNIANGTSVTIFGNATSGGDFSTAVVGIDLLSDVYILGVSSTTTGDFSAGILGASILGDVNIGVGAVSTEGFASAGIVGGSVLGDVNIASLFVTTEGDFSAGVVGGSIDGDVNMLLGAVSTEGAFSAGVVAGSVNGDVNALVGGVSTEGFASTGILAGSVNGNVNVGTFFASTEGAFSDAISATSVNGDVTVGSLFTSTEGFASDGIVAEAGRDASVYAGAVFTDGNRATGIQSIGGRDAFAFAAFVDTDGDFSEGVVALAGSGDATAIALEVETLGEEAHGVRAYSAGGDTNVGVGSVDTAGLGSHAVDAYSAVGHTNVFVADSAYGGSGPDGAGVSFGGGVGPNGGATLYNFGDIGSRNDRAIVNNDNDSTVWNLPFSTVTGFVEMGGGDDEFYNIFGAFVARGDSDWGAGDDLFYNAGIVTMAPRAVPTYVAFNNLETFDNDFGAILLANDIEGDYLDLAHSDFVGGGALIFDAYLGDDTSTADMLRIGGEVVATGPGSPTALFVNDTNGGFGAYAPNGIEVIDVSNTGVTQIGDFYLAGGPIDKGFFSYDLRLRPDDFWVLQSTPEQEAYELASLVTGAQNIWYTTAGAWNQRTTDLRTGFTGTGFGGGGADAVVETVVEPETIARNGVWARAIGDWGNYDADNGVSYRQDTYALQAGFDGSFDFGQGTMVAGLLGGFVKSTMDFDTATEVDYSGATGGAYLTYLQGELYIDALLKADILNADYNNGDFGASAGVDVTTIGASVETGYKFHVTPTAFIEPQAQLSYVSVQMDDADFDGTDVDWDDGESLRGRIGARLGTTITQENGAVLTPYLKASLLNEFLGDNNVNVAGFLTADDTSGTWGEVGGGLQFRTIGSVSGYVDGSYFFGNDANGGTVTGGIRHSF